MAAEACARVPEEWEIEGPGISLSLGDAADLDPELLAAMLGPDGLGGQALGPQFGQDAAADALRPGPILAALTEQAVADVATLTDDQLTGAMHAVRRLETRATGSRPPSSPSTPAAEPPSSPTPRTAGSPRAVGRGSSPTTSSRPSC